MRRRLTIAILAVVIGTLVLTVAASVLLVQRAAISTSENELTPEAQALGELVSVVHDHRPPGRTGAQAGGRIRLGRAS